MGERYPLCLRANKPFELNPKLISVYGEFSIDLSSFQYSTYITVTFKNVFLVYLAMYIFFITDRYSVTNIAHYPAAIHPSS